MQRHNVNVPTEFYARLARDVVRIAAEEGTSVEGRIISVLEGGYSDRALRSGVLSHLCGLAGDGPSSGDLESSGLGIEGQKAVPLRARKDSSASERGARRYEPSWWSSVALEELEAAMTPPPVVPPKPRNCTPPTYSSPTQASAAKAVMPKNRRSMSNLSVAARSELGSYSYFAPLPPPDVPWAVAALELSKLLIPTERQTNSCTHEDLNAEATRARRDRQSALVQSLPPAAGTAGTGDRPSTRMGLRERKAKPPALVEDDENRKGRRKTVAGPSVLSTEAASNGPLTTEKQPRQSCRRLSAASTIVSTAAMDAVPPAPRTAPIRSSSKADVTVRPESSTSVRTANSNALNVKKTRAPAKKEPVSRVPKVAKKLPGATNGAATQPVPAEGSSSAPASAEKTGDEVDKLTNEMRKIKITVINRAQREARERERLAREKLSKEETISVAPPPAVCKPPPPESTFSPTAAEQYPSPSPSLAPSASSPPPQSVLPSQHPSTPSLELNQPPSFLTTPPPTTVNTDTDADSRRVMSPPPPSQQQHGQDIPSSSSPARGGNDKTVDVFVPYQPEGPAPETLPLPAQQPLQWMPPSLSGAGTPVVSPVKRDDLPVFSSTGVIPFAPSPAKATARDGTQGREKDLRGGVEQG
jgi:histone deacetylase HOS3